MFENVSFAAGSEYLKLAVVLGLFSAVEVVASVFLAVNLTEFYLSLYIGLLAAVVGLVVLVTRDKRYRFSWAKMIFIGLLAAFNKGLSGGGFGPIVPAGQMMSGVGEKSAVCITLLSEALISLSAVFTYLWARGGVDWGLTLVC